MSALKPVSVSVDVPQPSEEIYEYLDVLGNHERFTDHFLVDWQLSGPRNLRSLRRLAEQLGQRPPLEGGVP